MMTISKSLLFCLVACCGLYGLSDGASLPSTIENAVEGVGSATKNLLPTINDVLGCNSSDSNNLPSTSELTDNPIKSVTKSLCYILSTVQDESKSLTDIINDPLHTIIPPVMAVLKNLNESNIVPDPLNTLLHTILGLYDINRLIMSAL
ncbi:uncharacterized protein LOC122525252 [Polistes fuscatus]|uniref:uncharacterized protein LOC122525252 n=1 Tax=Polistes fuscatus TaxID=30207 RepID=UPI001CA8AD76|nr:uncharacterized protein LOC122525252 [Polistes fuscatus]